MRRLAVALALTIMVPQVAQACLLTYPGSSGLVVSELLSLYGEPSHREHVKQTRGAMCGYKIDCMERDILVWGDKAKDARYIEVVVYDEPYRKFRVTVHDKERGAVAWCPTSF